MNEPRVDVDVIAWPTPDQPLLTERLVLRSAPGRRPGRPAALPRGHRRRALDAVAGEGPRGHRGVPGRPDHHDPREPGDWLVLAVQRRDDGRVIGEVLLKWEGPGQAEVGYALATDQHGQGFAREAVTEILRFAFEVLGVHRVVAITIDANDASNRLAEQIGMTREAHLVEAVWFKGAWASEYVYAIRAEQFRQSPHLG